ncbi:SGNH/GDSL hydrolase family protein [Mucilaginibacter ginkgonis]|uniref:G-D-S-L family lipolytic protein n=1 Tax=Mucilaginibacter ginkgonis TaxID=2682091 RepID=A0A6I4I5K6_9SPHI|nr:SGNH/GDSL hydrolase family protein [Mucilaginibacter ginkgonis]QQL49098.1 G-D-S-L family lipolytic protein [Mucilaginibacter ginkgonis]
MKFSKYILIIGAVVTSFAACKPDVQTPAPTRGSADFTRVISLGNSLTAGYQDNGLYLEGQQNSYPAIMAKQMLQTNGGPFYQPLFNEAQANGSGYVRIKSLNADGTPILDTVKDMLAIRGSATIPGFGSVTTYTKYTGDINNYGVPGIKVANITSTAYGNVNGYYERILPGNAGTNTTAYLDFATAKAFTFFTCWLGDNDVLGYAINGAASDSLTSQAYFTSQYTTLLNKLTATGAKGACAAIPDVTVIPYFNTVTPAKLLAAAQKVTPAVAAIYIRARTSVNATDTTHITRVAVDRDRIILTFPTAKLGTSVTTSGGSFPYGLSPQAPIEDKYVLDVNEVTLVQNTIFGFNSVIATQAATKGLAFVDIYAFLNDLKVNGYHTDGLMLTADYIKGGVFSLDGIHLTPRGYALVANQFISAINAKYGSNIPISEVATFRAVKFP